MLGSCQLVFSFLSQHYELTIDTEVVNIALKAFKNFWRSSETRGLQIIFQDWNNLAQQVLIRPLEPFAMNFWDPLFYA